MPLNAQTAKFDAAKKNSEQGSITTKGTARPRQRCDTMPAKAGTVMAA